MITKIIVCLGLLVAPGTCQLFAQCDKNSTIKSSTTSYLDSNGSVVRSVTEQSVFQISKTSFTIVAETQKEPIKGKITSIQCKWPIPYKDGSTVIEAELSGEQTGEKHSARLTITGKDGIVTIIAVIDKNQDRQIRLVADSFIEQK